MVENKYSKIVKNPYNDELIMLIASPETQAVTIRTLVPAIASSAPTPCETALAISSPRVCPLKLILKAKIMPPLFL